MGLGNILGSAPSVETLGYDLPSRSAGLVLGRSHSIGATRNFAVALE